LKRERDPENGKPRVNLMKKTRWELSRNPITHPGGQNTFDQTACLNMPGSNKNHTDGRGCREGYCRKGSCRRKVEKSRSGIVLFQACQIVVQRMWVPFPHSVASRPSVRHPLTSRCTSTATGAAGSPTEACLCDLTATTF
jgi:hypothetical protein